MSDKAPVKRVLIAGPLPPPWGGAAVSFALFKQWVEDQGIGATFYDIRWRKSSQEPLLGPVALWRNFILFCSLFKESLAYSHLVLFGSQRFVAWFGGPLILLRRLLGLSVSLRIFGGGFNRYLTSFPFLLRQYLYWSLGFAKTIVLQTDELKERLLTKIPTSLHVVSNYRQVSKGNKRPVHSESPFRFIFAGFIREEKGVQELLRAFTALRAKEEHIELYLVGPHFMEVLEQRGLHVCGEVEQSEVVELLQKSHCLVYPTKWQREGIPGILIEAGLVGLPIITTKWKAIPTIIEDGNNGLLVGPGDEIELADKMKKMLDDEELRVRLATNNKESMCEYTVDKLCPRLAHHLGVFSQEGEVNET